MKLGFQYGTRYIDFNVVFRDRKTMTIEVEPSGDVNVISPISATEEVILKKVKSKAKWIVQKQYEVKNINVRLLRGKFIVTTYTKDQDKIKLALENWYRDKTLKKAKERVKYYKSYFRDKVIDIKVKDQKKRWASCTKNNELLFNWRCVMAPSNILDYIVVHEMCHMKYKSHSKEFWDNVCSVLNDYEYRKEWLKNNGIKLDL